jgi:hypothetical protein
MTLGFGRGISVPPYLKSSQWATFGLAIPVVTRVILLPVWMREIVGDIDVNGCFVEPCSSPIFSGEEVCDSFPDFMVAYAGFVGICDVNEVVIRDSPIHYEEIV